MQKGKTIFLTVTNDLVYDQRMHRICGSLVGAGYQVTLVGRLLPDSLPLSNKPYQQVRLFCHYQKGKLFYLEYNFRLYKFLKNQAMDAICAIDLDTIVPVYLVSKKKSLPRMYDAHEFFTEMIEVKRRPHIHFIWKKIEQWLVPKFKNGYTVGQAIANDLKHLYGVDYYLVRNIPRYSIPINPGAIQPPIVKQIMANFDAQCSPDLPFILYQGAINEGRALHALADAMKGVNGRLLLAGNGNLESEIRHYIKANSLEHKIYMCGMVTPDNLRYLTSLCYVGITIFDAFSKNQFYSLANKFFDYIMALKPQVCVNYPEYAAILKQYSVAEPLLNTDVKSICIALNNLVNNPVLYENLQNTCILASKQLNWEAEEQTLLAAWDTLFNE
jgi:hypothetical protein